MQFNITAATMQWRVLISIYFAIFSFGASNCQIVQLQKKFFYFAYGSNLLVERIKINLPSAVFIAPAKLLGYRLDFDKYSSKWRGAPATIVQDPEQVVWGALWAVDYAEMEKLDRQEGVHGGTYFPLFVNVVLPEGHTITARTYQMDSNLYKVQPEDLPIERRPSYTYLQVIALGAYQCGIPSYYIGYIRRFPTNGRSAVTELTQELGYPFDAGIQIG